MLRVWCYQDCCRLWRGNIDENREANTINFRFNRGKKVNLSISRILQSLYSYVRPDQRITNFNIFRLMLISKSQPENSKSSYQYLIQNRKPLPHISKLHTDYFQFIEILRNPQASVSQFVKLRLKEPIVSFSPWKRHYPFSCHHSFYNHHVLKVNSGIIWTQNKLALIVILLQLTIFIAYV